MRASMTSVLIAGAFALAGAGSAAFAATETAVTVTTDNQSTSASIDYKAEREKCKTLPGSDQARCLDQVGVTTYGGEREGTATAEMGSLQGRDKCEQLNPEDRRECLINDKAGG
jgi:hypothetical protein